MNKKRSAARSAFSIAVGAIAATVCLATPAQATTGLSSIEALKSVAYVLVAVLALAWVFTVLGIRAGMRRRASHARQVGRPGGPRAPIGLRLLAWAQHGLAFVWVSIALIRLLFPSHYLNDSIHPDVMYTIWFGAIFAVLATVSAFGYSARSKRFGFRTGIALGWLCVLDPLFVIVVRGSPSAIKDILSPLFGVVVLLVLGFGYRRYFGFERLIWTRRRVGGAGRFAVAALITTVAFCGSSFVVMSRDFDKEAAYATLRELARGVEAYHVEHGRWPTDLSELEGEFPTRFGWRRIDYQPDQLRLALPVSIPDHAGLPYRLSFGILGDYHGTTELGRKLRDRRAVEPEAEAASG